MEQVKFSELTLDMFRMLQALEREPQEDAGQLFVDSSPAPGMIPSETNGNLAGEPSGSGPRIYRRENPHKYLLFKPTFSQFLVFLTSGFKELPINGVLLLFLSADGCFINSKQPEDSECLLFCFDFFLINFVIYFSSWLRLRRRGDQHSLPRHN